VYHYIKNPASIEATPVPDPPVFSRDAFLAGKEHEIVHCHALPQE
jgi:hypothetical protein